MKLGGINHITGMCRPLDYVAACSAAAGKERGMSESLGRKRRKGKEGRRKRKRRKRKKKKRKEKQGRIHGQYPLRTGGQEQ